MMRVELHLSGQDFYPSKLNIQTNTSRDRGSIGVNGRFRGLPVPSGYCTIPCPDTLHNEKIIWMCNYLLDNREYFNRNGCTDIKLWIYWEGIQGNMSFTKEEIETIAKCEIGFCLDYIQIDE